MRCVGWTAKGERVQLPAPVRLRLRSDEDAPADSLEARFPAWDAVGNLCWIQLMDRVGRVLFAGIVDEQVLSESGDGITVELSARSRAALLLDNEAQPQIYYMPSLKLLFERHAAPYGFTGYLGRDEVFGGAFTVEKGMSEWQALEAFCQTYLGVRLIARGDVLDASGLMQPEPVDVSRSHWPLSTCKIVWKDAARISELRMRTGDAADYDAILQDEEAVARGVVRRRYLSGSDVERAKDVLRKARQKAFAVQVCGPGMLCPPLGSPAKADYGENLYVSAWEYQLDSRGEISRVTLRRKEEG